MSTTFVLIERNGLPCNNEIYFCKAKRDLDDYCPSSVAFCSFRGSRLALQHVSNKSKVSLQIILHVLEYPPQILDQLKKMIIGHRMRMSTACGPEQASKSGKLRRHSEWNDAMAKCLQRVNSKGMPLSNCPCQLGSADVDEWATIGDPCASSTVSLDSMMSHACSLGRLSFKPYNKCSLAFGYRIPRSQWKHVLLHMLKEQLMQGLVAGNAHVWMQGAMVPGEHDEANDESGRWHCFELSKNAPVIERCENFRNHISFLLIRCYSFPFGLKQFYRKPFCLLKPVWSNSKFKPSWLHPRQDHV